MNSTRSSEVKLGAPSSEPVSSTSMKSIPVPPISPISKNPNLNQKLCLASVSHGTITENPALDPLDEDDLDAPLRPEEIDAAVKQLNRGKTPGYDGLT